jgi:dipeptidyl aminopeptidase/acylaminoacyl peptidase
VAKALACSIVLGLLAIGSLQARPFTAKDLALQERVSDPRISPDGRFVAYNVRSTDWDGNRGLNALWVLERGAPNAVPRLIRDQEKAATQPRWSADGRWLYFLSARSGVKQLWRTSPNSPESQPVTNLPLDVSFYRIKPDGRGFVVAASVYPECQTMACSKAQDDAKSKQKSSGVLYDTIGARFWDSYLDGHFMGLFSVPLDADNPASDGTNVTLNYRADIVEKPEGDDSSFVVSPDGRTVIFSARPSGSDQGMGEPQSLFTVPLDGGSAPVRIDPTAATSDDNPAVSRDGRWLAYLSHQGSVFTAPRAHLLIRDLKAGTTRELAAAWLLSPESIAWSMDSTVLYALVQDAGQRRLFAIDLKTGGIQALTGDGHVGAVDVSRGVLVVTRDSLGAPAQIVEIDGARREHALTHVGEDARGRTPLSLYESFRFAGWNNETVQGYVVKPADFQVGRKYPVAFLIHGGPHGSFSNAWSYRWNPQVWAGMGYAVVMIDFHGSSGFGEAFAKSIIGHWGDRPLVDLQNGWAYALSKYEFLDGEHACALGGSYGGYMVAWIAGNWTKPWKCLVNHDGVFDLRLMSYSTDIPGFQEAQNTAATWVDPAAVERFNPIDHVADWTIPILVVHGGRDDRVPLDQGMGAFEAAQLRHVPSQLLYFSDENHWVLKPQNSVQWYATVEAWMKRWLDH